MKLARRHERTKQERGAHKIADMRTYAEKPSDNTNYKNSSKNNPDGLLGSPDQPQEGDAEAVAAEGVNITEEKAWQRMAEGQYLRGRLDI